MSLTVTIYPHPVLKQAGNELTQEQITTSEIQQLIDDMIATMYQARGVGLAAPQINKLLRLTVIDAEDGAGARVLINPQIISYSKRTDIQEEGCLSLPGVYGMVGRHKKVTVEYLDRTGAKQTLKAPAFLSRVLQHEIDHLNGILFIDHAKSITQGKALLEQWNNNQTPLLDIPYPYTYT